MKHIHIIEMGGTISAKGVDALDYKDYTSGYFDGEDYIKQIPSLADLAYVTFTPFSQISSTKITTSHWVELRELILHTLENSDVDGFVITHGTSTLEETAYFLHVTLPTNKPIVFVGAQRPFTAISTDAPLNLLNAVRVAAADESMGKGVLVVLNDQICSARDATKGDTYRVHSFHSHDHGILGIIDVDQQVHYYRAPTRKHTAQSVFSQLPIHQLANVEILYSYAGSTGYLVDAIVAQNYEGIVLAGTGAGLLTPGELTKLTDATDRGLFVVRSSRVGSGRVVPLQQY